MLGLVFTEFMDMVEDRFSADMVDDLIDENDLASEGAYTSVGLYDYNEMISLVTTLSEKTGIATSDLIESFGSHLATVFSSKYPDFYSNTASAFDFFKLIHDHIHVEVKKLYDVAELPVIEARQHSENKMSLEYRSRRPFGDLALGLIKGTINHYGENIKIDREIFDSDAGSHQLFTLTRQSD